MTAASYKTYLRAIGRKPIPAVDKLRTQHLPGDKILTIVGAQRAVLTVPGRDA